MARSKRTCEQCGGTSSPHIPRQRVDGRLLCQGCAARELSRKTSAKTPDQQGQSIFDFWDGDLAPNENLHPLQQPLPNSVWEKYAKHRELLGKPKIFLPDHLEEAEARGKAKAGDSDPFPGSRADVKKKQQGPGKQPRLPFWRRKKGSLGKTAESEKPSIESMPGQEAKSHLSMHHGWTDQEIEHAGLKGQLYDLHNAEHSDPKVSGTLFHSHQEPEKPASQEAPHPSEFTPKSYIDHMVEHHGWTAENAKTHADAGMENALTHHKLDHQIASDDHSDLGHTHKKLGEIPHPQGPNELTMHLLDHHGMGDWEIEHMDEPDLQDQHDQFHNSTAYSGDNAPDHSHPEGMAEKETTGHGGHLHPEDMTQSQLEEHLMGPHAISQSAVDKIKSKGITGESNETDHENLLKWHNNHHKYPLSGFAEEEHEHPSAPAGKSQVSSGKDLHPPAKSMKGKALVEHLKWDHELPLHKIHQVMKSGGDKPLDGGVGAAQKWHDEQHAAGADHAHGHAHEEFGANGPEELKHPSKFTNNSLHSHLLEDHGIDPDHMKNALEGTYEATDLSHVVHMMHNAAHANGQVKFEHTHEGWSGGPKIHEGHTDLGKPFWGAPPSTVQKSLDHLMAKKSQGGHGLSQDVLGDLVKPHTGGKTLLEDSEYHEIYEKVHGDLHQQSGEGIGHQHVPTIQPDVKSPEKIKKEQLQKHLHEYHGVSYAPNPEMTHSELHDKDAFAYKGHPGHEHVPWDQHGSLTQELPSGYSMPPNKNPEPGDFVSIKPWNPGHHDHPTNMSHQDLAHHIQSAHSGWTAGKNGEAATPPSTEDFATSFFNDFGANGSSKEELLQKHALMHASGETNGHTHEAGGWDNPLENTNAHYGVEPEIQTDTHPHVDNDHDALAHMIKHHPNVTQENYDDWHKSNQTGVKPTMVKFHDALHNGGTFGSGEKLPKVLDGHDHADPSGPPTQIAVGSHLVHEHGMTQQDVAAMTPAEFKAHHEQLHLKKSELDIGHGHDYPGGPQRDPRVILPNTHHKIMRDNDRHPAVQEWYHGTGTNYDGPPKNATELQEDHGFWGNFGDGDWNNHVGTHWTSLHDMARNFNGSNNRVIHAKLHISNPITYNSLNHMAHDAYERLRASGHLQDDGRFENNHADDSGYNHCCSDRLLQYAKGRYRSDGKYGLEAYRDSLRASGYDGIHVRNQADHPAGHWNAIPLSGDQIEITHGGCRGGHDDERDEDVREFQNNPKLKAGWVHPKHYDSTQYIGPRLSSLPGRHDVTQAHEEKSNRTLSNKTAVGRGDSDPYLGNRDPEDLSNNTHWCEHCEETTDHESDDCTISKYCSVCEEDGDHLKDDSNSPHSYCEHCEDYADHESDDCEKNPDNMKVEAYCPHCNESHEGNKHNENCVNCGNKLPDWGKLQTQGKPVKPDEYEPNGETDETNYHPALGVQSISQAHELASHLYHHHKSNVGGKEFDQNGNWNEDALKAHHQWLHQNPGQASSAGFEMDHEHKQSFGQFKKEMTPEETQAHLLLAHAGSQHGGISPVDIQSTLKMTPEEAVEAHKKAHMADDAVHWGEKDSDKDFLHKLTHTHDLEGDQGSFDEAYYPDNHEDLVSHITDPKYHSVSKSILDKVSPEVTQALHHQLHKSFGAAAQEGFGKYHVHTPEMLDEIHKKQAILHHLTESHGADQAPQKISGKSIEDLMKFHGLEHTSSFPEFGEAGHVHFGGAQHADPEGHTDATMKKVPTKSDQVKQHLKEHHGATGEMKGLTLKDAMMVHKAEHGPNPILKTPGHEHPGLGSSPADYANHVNESMKSTNPFDELKSTPANDLLTKNYGYDMESHISAHHKDDVEPHLKHADGFDYSPGSPQFVQALQEAHEAHLKAHAKDADHNHGGSAPLDMSKVMLDWPDEKKPKEASARTLSDLFEEVAS